MTRIVGTGMAVPPYVVDHRLLSRCMSTTDEWIARRIGIRTGFSWGAMLLRWQARAAPPMGSRGAARAPAAGSTAAAARA